MCTCVSYFRLINRKPYERKNIIDNRPIKTLSFQTFLPFRNLDDPHEFPLNIFDDRLLTRRSIHLRVAVHRYSPPRASSLSKPFIPSVYLLLERKPGILKLLERKKTIVAFLRSFGGHERKKWKRIEIYPARILENYRLDFCRFFDDEPITLLFLRRKKRVDDTMKNYFFQIRRNHCDLESSSSFGLFSRRAWFRIVSSILPCKSIYRLTSIVIKFVNTVKNLSVSSAQPFNYSGRLIETQVKLYSKIKRLIKRGCFL